MRAINISEPLEDPEKGGEDTKNKCRFQMWSRAWLLCGSNTVTILTKKCLPGTVNMNGMWVLRIWLPINHASLPTKNQMRLHFTGPTCGFLSLLIGQEVSNQLLWNRKGSWEEEFPPPMLESYPVRPSIHRKMARVNSSHYWSTQAWVATKGSCAVTLNERDYSVLSLYPLLWFYFTLYVSGEAQRSEFNALMDTNNTVFLSSFPPCYIHCSPLPTMTSICHDKRPMLPWSTCYAMD